MGLSQLMDAEMLVGFFEDVLVIGFIPGFMIAAVLHLLAFGIFKALSFLNIRH